MQGETTGKIQSAFANNFASLRSLLDSRANEFPDRIAFVFEAEDGSQIEWTYQDVQTRSLAVAEWVSQHASPGDRALLVYPPGLEFIAGFFGSIYAGVLPVPTSYPKPRRPLPRAESIVNDCEPRLVLSQSSVLETMEMEDQIPPLRKISWKATDQLQSVTSDSFEPVHCEAEDLAFLQYTSGSTSEPRGVMISHRNILHNLESIRTGFQIALPEQSTEVPSGVFWLPAYHDMGLIGGILTPVYVGGTSYLMPPTAFLRRPLRWLELMSQTKAEFSGAPNFGYEMAVQKSQPEDRARLDLSHWNSAFCGAEPINHGTLEDFANAFEATGFRSSAFYPCYGMAEVTLLVTGGCGPAEPKVIHLDRQRLFENQAIPVDADHAQAQTHVGCGNSLDGQVVKIVEPNSHEELSEGAVGEIWVHGESVARGYWNRAALNEETFQAKLPSQNGKAFLRTGDLGFYWQDELFVTGRLKDIIIIRGRNYYPQDIERTSQQAHAAVDLGVAFSIPGKRQEELVAIHQIDRQHRKADMDEVLQAVRSAILAEYELEPSQIVLIRPASLPITSSGKVQRNRCKELFLADELSVVAHWKASEDAADEATDQDLFVKPDFLNRVTELSPVELAQEVQAWFVDWLPLRANLIPGVMQAETLFAELGIDSLTAVEISQDIDKILELEIPPMEIWSCPNAQALSEYLASQLIDKR